MRKQAELEEADSCLNRAAPDEPVFVLRANDPLFPVLVRAWAVKYCAAKVKLGAFGSREALKHLEALQLAKLGEAWRAQAHKGEDGRPRLTMAELLTRWRQAERERQEAERG